MPVDSAIPIDCNTNSLITTMINRPFVERAIRVLPLLVAALFLAAAPRARAEKPNILFLFADDMCYEILGALGHTDIDTPNLDRLVESGTTFTHAYNPGSWSGAVCVASRTMINTGRFLWNANKVYKDTAKEQQEGRFWSEYMKQAGYHTYFTGKWHVRADANKAFDMARNVRGGMPKQTPEGYNRPIDGQPDPWSPYDPKFGGFWEGGTHWSEVVRNDALDFLAHAGKSDKPFFMYTAFNAVHDPRQAPKEYIDRYPLSRIKMPRNWLAEYPYKDAIGCSAKLRDEKLAPFPRTENAIKVNRQEYYAIAEHMDEQIGRILDGLKKSGKADNTYIFFTADHGLGVGHHGLLGKQNLYDHSVRVPFIAVGPGIAKNRKIATPIYLQDVMPTTLALAGVEKPDHVEFQNLLPILRGEQKKSEYTAIYGAYLALQRSIIVGNNKLILYPKISKARLYNLKNDPDEMKDLIDTADGKKLAKRLFQRLLKMQQQNNDSLDLKAAFPKL